MKFLISVVSTLLFALSAFAQTQAEVVVPTTFLRKSPNSIAEKVQSVQKGEKIVFEKIEDADGWYYVSIPNTKVKGWINGNAITRVNSPEAADQNTPRASQNAAGNPQSTPRTVAQNQGSAPETARSVQPSSQSATRSPESTSTPATTTAIPTAAPENLSNSVLTGDSPKTAEIPAEDDEVLRIDTEEVTLNVRVVDDQNRAVSNLTEAHFQIYEDGARQPITSLTTAEVPINYALLVDNSRSLRSQLGKITEAGKVMVGANHPKDESTLVRFVSKDKIEVVQDFTTDKNRLEAALDNLFVEGGQTAIIDAVYLTAKRVDQYEKSRRKDDLRRRALILVSDGDDRGSSRSEQQLFELLRSSEVQIYAVGFVNDLSDQKSFGEEQSRREKAKAFLTRLAAETGGKVYFPASAEELPQIARDVSQELRMQYLITYAPTGEKSDKSFRNIKVMVADGANQEKRTAVTRTGRAPETEEKASTQKRQSGQQKP